MTRSAARWRVCGALLALGSCSPAPAPPATSGRSAAPVVTAPPTADAATGTSADVVVAEALAEVSRYRRLEAKGPVRGKTISRGDMVEMLREQIRREIPERVVKAQNELLFAWGLAPAVFDFEQALLALMKSQLAGFYDPRIKTMFLLEDLGDQERVATLAHELVHALQDQHWDLEKHVRFEEGAGDRIAAIHALAEGDATSAMMDTLLGPRGVRAIDVSESLFGMEAEGAMELAPELVDVPRLVKRSVIAPYVDGLAFVHWLRRRGDWAEVDAAWARLPVSTEQVLHPEKYLAGEVGESVPEPSPPPGGPSTRVYRDVLGEQTLRLVFEEWMPSKTAHASAAGWGGDQVAVFSDRGSTAVAWRLRFDDEASARAAMVAFTRGILGSAAPVDAASAAQRAAGGKICAERAGSGPFAARRTQRDLVVVAGPFQRGSAGPTSAGSCADSLTWASLVLAKR